MSVSLGSKISAPLILLFGTFGFGILPMVIRRPLLSCNCDTPICKTWCRDRIGKKVTSSLIHLGGGVLLAVCLIHLLPEAIEGFEEHEKRQKSLINVTEDPHSNATEYEGDGHERFPMAEFAVCCGFFCFYFIEEFLHCCWGGDHHQRDTPFANRDIHAQEQTLWRSNSIQSIVDGELSTEISSCRSCGSCDNLYFEDDSDRGLAIPENYLTGRLRIVALGFHSLFDGLALGMQDSEKSFWILFCVVALHTFAIAFVVVLEALRIGASKRTIATYMISFVISPLVMALVSFLENNHQHSPPLAFGWMNGFATGTLLYMTFCEMFRKGKGHTNLKEWQEFLATSVGFGIISFLHYVIPFKSSVPRSPS